MLSNYKKLGLAVLGLGVLAPAAHAATATANLTVTATVLDACNVVATALAFGNLNAAGDTDAETLDAIVVTCTSAKSGVKVALGGGLNNSGGQRQMKFGASSFVPYNIYADSGHGSPVAVDANIFDADIPAATPVGIDVYGQVPAGSYAAGAYTDTVLITVTYP